MRTYKGLLNSKNMPENGIFVFGSNPIGINGNPKKGTGGSALIAHLEFGVELRECMDNCLSKNNKAYGINLDKLFFIAYISASSLADVLLLSSIAPRFINSTNIRV